MSGSDEDTTDITYTITVPANGGWGWIVVAASFYSMGVQNGILFSFGSLINSISKDLGKSQSLVALIGSLQMSLYFLMCPVASAFINRFGFRICSITGCLISSVGIMFAYLSSSYAEVLVTYGIINGIGMAFMNMASLLIVGFYFEKHRSLALSITSLGSSLGTMAGFPLNTYLLKLDDDWKRIVLLQAGLTGSIYFISLTYRPLPTLKVIEVDEQHKPKQSVAVLPNLKDPTKATEETTKAERVFGAVSNTKYPTADTLIKDDANTKLTSDVAGPSKPQSRKSIIIVPSAVNQFTPRHLEMTKSLASQRGEKGDPNKDVKKNAAPPRISVQLPEQIPLRKKKRNWLLRCCVWEKDSEEARPMYRDDTFYEGKVENLPAYKKSVVLTKDEEKTGLEYQLAVARATTNKDLEERKGLCSTAIKRVLATMLDFTSFLKIPSFTVVCLSGFLCYCGMLVPYVLLTDRNQKEGLQSSTFVSAIGLSTTIGRLIFGYFGDKFSSIKLYAISLTAAGAATVFSNFQFTFAYQYGYCVIYGFFVAGISSIRCLVLITLYGLSKLTNATGVFFMFLGFGAVFSTPVASLVRDSLGYAAAFYYAGSVLIISGTLIFFIKPPTTPVE